MSYVRYVCDVETTGRDPKKHDIIEVCFWRHGDAESKTWWLTPLSPENIEDEALSINKHLKEDILHQTDAGKAKYRHPSEVLPEIEMWLMEDGAAAEERVFVGQNPDFDYGFLLELWKKLGAEDDFPFGYWIESKDEKRNQGYIIDTMQLARLIDICTGKKRARYGLGSLVKDFGVTKSTAHRADGDVKMTKELFDKIFNVLQGPLAEAFMDSYKDKDVRSPTKSPTPLKRECPDNIKELVECLEWYVENDETNHYPDNEFWVDGLERAKKALDTYHAEEISKKLT